MFKSRNLLHECWTFFFCKPSPFYCCSYTTNFRGKPARVKIMILLRCDLMGRGVCVSYVVSWFFFLYSPWKTPRLSFPLVRHGFSWPTRFSWAQEQSTIELAWWDINNSRRIFVRSGRPESVPFRSVYTSAKLASSTHGRVFFCFDKIDGFNGRDLTKNGFWLKISCPFVPPPRCTTTICSSMIASFHDVVRNCRL